jgi:hypothetical protein
MAKHSVARHVVASCLACELPPLFSLPLSSCRAAQASFSLSRRSNVNRRHMLVLDIDETLIYTYKSSPSPASPRTMEFCMLLRPHVEAFLLEVEQLFDIVFWTAGTASYCAAVLGTLQEALGRNASRCYSAHAILDAASKSGDEGSLGVAAAQRQLLKDALLSPEVGQDKYPPWPSLSRSQTLQELDYMKYLPLLGVGLSSVVMVDDHERSFPLAPRNGLKLPRFAPPVPTMPKDASPPATIQVPHDEHLLHLLPVLRSVAAAADVAAELDHWRPDEYVQCDGPLSMMNPLSLARRKLLGNFICARRSEPIPPLGSYDRGEPQLQSLLRRVEEASAETTSRANQSRRWGPLLSHI